MARTVDAFEVTREDDRAQKFVEEFDVKFEFDEVRHVPGKLQFVSIKATQNGD